MSHVRTERPAKDEYSPFFEGYISRVDGGEVEKLLAAQLTTTTSHVAEISGAKAGHRYAPGKWSVRQVVGHVIDAERIFAYRALSISRGETKSLPGWDENEYMPKSPFERYTMRELADEFSHVRRSNLALFAHLDDEAWMRRGTANDRPVSVRALAFIMAGHLEHHLAVLRERYGV